MNWSEGNHNKHVNEIAFTILSVGIRKLDKAWSIKNGSPMLRNPEPLFLADTRKEVQDRQTKYMSIQ